MRARRVTTVARLYIIGLTCFAFHQLSFAERSFQIFTTALPAIQTPPVVDGIRNPDEYAGGWRSSRILYRPRSQHDPALVEVVATADSLYFAASGLPFGFRNSSGVSFLFDTRGNGGQVPDSDDLLFDLSESSTFEVLRGDGRGGFTADPSVQGWSAAVHAGRTAWTAELRIPIALLGRPDAHSTTGFVVRHHDVEVPTDTYTWPPNINYLRPSIWGGLIAALQHVDLGVDVYRLTQGVEYDVDAGVFTDFIAGKDTLLRVQLYADALLPQKISSAKCLVVRTFPSPGVLALFTGYGVPSGPLPKNPVGYFNGSPVIDFWFPGTVIPSPGSYSFLVTVTLEGHPESHSFAFGKFFQTSGNLRVLAQPWVNTFAYTRPWGPDLTAAIPTSMEELNRLYPVRSGISLVNDNPLAGIRYHINPLGQCAPSDVDFTACDNRGRAMANTALHSLNSLFATFGQFDRIDRGLLLAAADSTGGGQAQTGWSPCSPGAAFDANLKGASASVIAQEIAHCFGLVQSDSPHYDGGSHSINVYIPLLKGIPAVNMRTHTDVAKPRSVLYGFVDVVPNSFMEGQEWNDLRKALANKPPQPAPRRQAPMPLFLVEATIDLADQVNVLFSQKTDDGAYPASMPDPSSPYQLVFLSAADDALSTFPFRVSFEASHQDDFPVEGIGFVVAAPLPGGAARFEIRDQDILLYAMDFSVEPPVVSNVMATSSPMGGFDVDWMTSDADSADLHYGIFFLPAIQGPRIPVAMGVGRSPFHFDTGLVPPTMDGRLIVMASDGFNTGEEMSEALAVPPQPPAVAISNPTTGTEVVAGQTILLVGAVHDLTSGPLTDDALQWTSDMDGPLGSGEQRETALSPGIHVLTLTATGPSGLTASAYVTVEALLDTDGDGLPDTYEDGHGCLQFDVFDSQEDPDGDGLASLAERRIGTDPCDPDSDQDGVGDGDEVRLGSDPLVPGIPPAPDLLFIPAVMVDLGSDDQPVTITIPVRTESVGTEWAVAADSDWIVASMGGVGDGEIVVYGNPETLTRGKYYGHLMVTSPDGQPRLMEVQYQVGSATASGPVWRLYR